MGSNLLEQHTFARLLDRGELARHLRRVRPIYRRRRDAAIAALARLLPEARWQGAAAGLHLYVTLPADVDAAAVRRAAYRRGVLIEDAAQHWADPAGAAPAFVVGYGSLPEPGIAAALTILRDAVAEG
jgi:GntR family transcriptional regulator/MocR family aminotransferase